jgi:hypothetical protein
MPDTRRAATPIDAIAKPSQGLCERFPVCPFGGIVSPLLRVVFSL